MPDFPDRIGFAGTPEFAATLLNGLLAAKANVVAVYSRPDKPTGRGRKLKASPVKQRALDAGLNVLQPKSLRTPDALTTMQAQKLDVLVVAAYGLILPQEILDTPTLGCINVHASLLPRWRGAAPIERAIMAGDTESGVSIMRMEAGLDTGGVYLAQRLPITDTTTGLELHDAIANLGTTALLQTLDGFKPAAFEAQNDALASYADKLTAADADIDWQKSASRVARHINALNDRLPARTTLINPADTDETLNLLRASVAKDSNTTATPGTLIARSKKSFVVACGEGAVNIHELQLRRGKGRPMPVAAALNGYSDLFTPGQQFHTAPGNQ